MKYVNGLVSISIVAWNSKEYIGKCLDCVSMQTYPDIEVTVIDNNSVDGTVEYLKKNYSDIRLIENNINKGYCGGHNIGIRKSKGEFILCLNPDVFIERRYIEELAKAMDSDRSVGGAIGKLYQYTNKEKNGYERSSQIIDTAGLSILKSRKFIARGYGQIDWGQFNKSEYIVGVDGMAPIYKKEMLEQIKIDGEYFDELFFAYCEDQDLSWRAQIYGWKFIFIPKAIAYHVRTFQPSNLKARKLISSEMRSNAIRNHYLMVLKNDFKRLFLKYMFYILSRALKISGYILLFEQSSIKGIIEFIRLTPVVIRKRKIIMKNRKITYDYMAQWFS